MKGEEGLSYSANRKQRSYFPISIPSGIIFTHFGLLPIINFWKARFHLKQSLLIKIKVDRFSKKSKVREFSGTEICIGKVSELLSKQKIKSGPGRSLPSGSAFHSPVHLLFPSNPVGTSFSFYVHRAARQVTSSSPTAFSSHSFDSISVFFFLKLN